MGETFQALKPGGVVSVTEVAIDPRRQNGDEIRRLAEAVGFVEQARFDGWLVFTMNLMKPV